MVVVVGNIVPGSKNVNEVVAVGGVVVGSGGHSGKGVAAFKQFSPSFELVFAELFTRPARTVPQQHSHVNLEASNDSPQCYLSPETNSSPCVFAHHFQTNSSRASLGRKFHEEKTHKAKKTFSEGRQPVRCPNRIFWRTTLQPFRLVGMFW